MSIPAFLDAMVYIVLGICFIHLSFSKKEKLGKKVELARWGGIVAIFYGIFQIVCAVFFKK